MLTIVPRHELDAMAWDACIAASPQRILYGYSWYLDTVLHAPVWKWVGIVLMDEKGYYQAVMPIPLRRKSVAGIPYEWVVHQPFFCQFLGIFSREESLDTAPFFRLLVQEFRYGSIYCMHQQPTEVADFNTIRTRVTHTLDLSVDYKTIYQHYTRDRKLNLRRAIAANWTVFDSSDPEPLLALFRQNHADTLDGGVAEWAYDILRKLIHTLRQRNLINLRYASHNGRTEAGVLFVEEGNRIIYLFNAASATGRKGNARTLLIDHMIQQSTRRTDQGRPVLFDFESPEKVSISSFYQSFGAVPQSFCMLRWSRLTWPERVVQSLVRLRTRTSS